MIVFVDVFHVLSLSVVWQKNQRLSILTCTAHSIPSVSPSVIALASAPLSRKVQTYRSLHSNNSTPLPVPCLMLNDGMMLNVGAKVQEKKV